MPKVISIWLWEAAKGNEFQRLRLLLRACQSQEILPQS